MGFINLIYTFIRCVASFVVPISIMWGVRRTSVYSSPTGKSVEELLAETPELPTLKECWSLKWVIALVVIHHIIYALIATSNCTVHLYGADFYISTSALTNLVMVSVATAYTDARWAVISNAYTKPLILIGFINHVISSIFTSNPFSIHIVLILILIYIVGCMLSKYGIGFGQGDVNFILVVISIIGILPTIYICGISAILSIFTEVVKWVTLKLCKKPYEKLPVRFGVYLGTVTAISILLFVVVIC